MASYTDKHSDYTADQVIQKLGVESKRFGVLQKIQCYNTVFHTNGDASPSLTVYDYDKGYYCYACGESGSHSWLFKKFNVEDERFKYNGRKNYSVQPERQAAEAPKKSFKTYPLGEIQKGLEPLTPEEASALQDKGFSWERWEAAGWRHHSGQIEGWPQGIFIPYMMDGEIVSARLRNLNGNPRFLGLKDGETRAFMLDNLKEPICYVTEGETDCMTLNFCGLPAVGVPGSQHLGPMKEIIEGAAENGTRLIVIPDNDKAGDAMLAKFRGLAFDHFVAVDVFEVPGYKDVNEWFCSVGQEAFESTLRHETHTVTAAPPPKLSQEELL